VLWAAESGKEATVTGEFEGGFRREIRDVADWLSVNTLAAVLGALYGAGIEAPQEAAGSPAKNGSNAQIGTKVRNVVAKREKKSQKRKKRRPR
jgi:hypothetical protein